MSLLSIIASLPSPSSGAISIGPLTLRAYGLMIALGVIAAVWIFGRELERRGYGDADDASAIGMWGVGAGIIGARLYHVATDWERFSDNLGAIPKIWEGGLGIPGGLLAGAIVGTWAGRQRGIPTSVQLTGAAMAIPLAQSIARWGNWFNQELFGRATDLPWALEIDADHLPAGYEVGTTFHPTFLYESLWNLALFGVLVAIDRKLRLGAGRLMAIYLIGYGSGRFWIEGLRIDPAHNLGGLRWNQWVSLAAIAGGVLWLALTKGKAWPPKPAVVTADAHAHDDDDDHDHDHDHGDEAESDVELDGADGDDAPDDADADLDDADDAADLSGADDAADLSGADDDAGPDDADDDAELDDE